MSILIKGMEMPTSCYACMFFAQTNNWNKEDEADILSRCKRTGEKTWESVNGYLPNCPLVSVPPHGRLIDADALMDLIRAHDYPLTGHFNSRDNGMFTIGIQQAVDETPTIIPAEEGE